MWSIRDRLVRTFMIVAAGFALLAGVALIVAVEAITWVQSIALLTADAGRLALSVRNDSERPMLRALPAGLRAKFDVSSTDAYFQIWSADGSTIAKSDSLGARSLAPPPIAEPNPGETARFPEEIEFGSATLPDGRSASIAWVRWVPPGIAEHDGEEDPRLTLVVAHAGGVLRLLRLGLYACGGLLICGGLVALTFITRAIVAHGMEPITRLSHQVASVDAERLGSRVTTAGMPDELRPLGDAFNATLCRLDEAFQHERRFSRNAAHELRTPLAEIRAVAEHALRRAADPQSQSLALRDISGVAARADDVLTALLQIARAQASEWRGERVCVDLAALVREETAGDEASLIARGIRLVVDLPETLSVHAERGALETIVANLARNACEYTPSGGSISVALRVMHIAGQRPEIELLWANGPTDLQSADLASMCEPFWRKTPRRGDGTHSGLGLTLVHAFVHGLGGTLDLELTPDAHVRIRVRLPRDTDEPVATMSVPPA